VTRNRAALDDVAAAALWAEGYLLERGTEDLRANLHRLSFEAFLDAIDVPLEDIEWFGDPQDETPQDAPGPKMPRPASAGGVGRGARATRSSGR
jgi:hypothetical protein